MRILPIALIALLLAACGGGNSSSGPAPLFGPDFSTPEATVKSLVEATKARAPEQAADCWVASEREGKLESYSQAYGGGGSTHAELQFVRVEQKLGFTIGTYGFPDAARGFMESHVALVNENGQWKCSDAEWKKYWKALLAAEKR